MVADRDGVTRVERETGDLYGFIWSLMSDEVFEKFSDDHWNKFRNSGLPAGFLEGKVCLDAGCGSGRAVRSILKDGASKVHAIDVGEQCVASTRLRNRSWQARLEVRQGSVLALPYPDDYFDFVHCDGVLHHTSAPYEGFRELVRVAKPGAAIMFGLYGAGGLLNFCIYSARLLRRVVPRPFAERVLRMLTSDPIKIYVFLDPLYVPIRRLYRQRDAYEWAARAGVERLKRLEHKYSYTGIDRLLKDYNSFGGWLRGAGYLTYLGFKRVRG